MGLRVDFNLDYPPNDETDEIVKFIVHPDIKTLINSRLFKPSQLRFSEKDIYLGLDENNILTVEINLDHDPNVIVKVLKNANLGLFICREIF